MCQVRMILFNKNLITKNRSKDSLNHHELLNCDQNIKNILASLARIFSQWNSFRIPLRPVLISNQL